MKRSGFSLIEILVVMAIIAVLAAILFPVFARAKTAAGDARSISNAKQLGDAFLLYLGDSDDVIPSATEGDLGVNRSGGWTYYTSFTIEGGSTFDVTKGSIYPYVTDRRVFQSSGNPDAARSGNSFAVNGILNDPTSTGINPGHALGTVERVADTMLLGEEGCGNDNPLTYGFDRGTNDGYFNVALDHFAKFHPGGAVILYCDGHAKIVPAQDRFVQTVCGSETKCWN